MLSVSESLGLIELLYAAAAGGELLIDALGGIVAALAADAGGLIVLDPAGARIHEGALVGVTPELQQSYGPLVTRQDMRPVFTRVAKHIPADGVVDEVIGAGPDLDRTAFKQEWLRPLCVDHYLMSPIVLSPPRLGFLVVTRSAATGRFDGDARASIAVLRPHLVRAMQLRSRLDGAAFDGLAALDRICQGVLLLDGKGRIRHANSLGEAILRDGDGLRNEAGILTCQHAEDATALRRAIDASARMVGEAPHVLAIRRRSARRPLSVLIAPLRGRSAWTSASPACCAIVTDAERAQPASPATMRRLYGLTAAEARIAAALLESDRLVDVAEKLSISLSTVRTLLQRVFAKTDTHRQAQLVRLMMAHQLPDASVGAGSSGRQ